MLEFILYIFALLFLLSLIAILFIPLIKGAPYVPTSDKRLKALIDLVRSQKKGGNVVDIGSGDGKILIALARLGYKTYGYEINPLLVLRSRLKIRQLQLKGKAFVSLANMWSVDYSAFDIVVIYGLSRIMKDMEKKLKKELKPNSIIVSVAFKFPSLKLVKETNDVRLYKL